ncbi:MAG: hypothetical protein EXX96DRAFT_525631 [Benjaminiella poitrasii]|nr:MAG: hypothetical protein EXX96DRAFT_525631 [Benjaminiella poitrasii]
MLRIYSRSTVLLKRQASIRPIACHAFRCNSTLNNDNSHKIYALPFKLPEDKIQQIVSITSYVNEHAFLSIFKIIKSLFTGKMPQVKESVRDMQVRKAYIPFWYYDMAISADITPSSKNPDEPPETMIKTMGSKRQALGIGLNCYWPGHTWDPVSYLSFGPSLDNNLSALVPFTSELYEDKGNVEVLPFTVNPFKDLAERAPNALENLKVNLTMHKNGVMTVNNAKVIFNAVYPVYWPVYVAQFTSNGQQQQQGEEIQKTIVVGAHSLDPPVYQWDPKVTGVKQWINNGPWIKLDASENEWQMGLGTQPPLHELEQRFLEQVVGRFQVNEIDWEDERIQAYPNYQKQNKAYLTQLFKVWAERSMLARIEGLDENQKTLGVNKSNSSNSVTSVPRIQVKTVKEIREDIESRVIDDLNKLEELEPVWYKNYREKQESK